MGFSDLDAAVAELEARAKAIAAEPPLEDVSMLREWKAADRINARLQISAGGPLRGRAAGVDVRGDGRIVGWWGRVWRQEVERTQGTVFDAVRETLEPRTR